MTGQKFTDRQALAPRLLQFTDRQGPFAAGNDNAVAVDTQYPPFFTRTANRHGMPQLDGLAAETGLGSGNRIEGTDMTIQILRTLRPVDKRLRLAKLRCVGDPLRGLRDGRPRQSGQRLDHQSRAEAGQTVVQRCARVARLDRASAPKQHRPGIETRLHPHDADTGLAIAGEQRALDRCRPAPAWQQRGMDIDAAKARNVEHGLRQDEAVGGDHHDVRQFGGDSCLRRCILQCQRLKHLDATLHREPLDGRRLQGHAAPRRPVWLGEDQTHRMPRRHDRLHCHCGKIGSPGEDHPHAVTRACLASLFRMRVCFNCDR